MKNKQIFKDTKAYLIKKKLQTIKKAGFNRRTRTKAHVQTFIFITTNKQTT